MERWEALAREQLWQRWRDRAHKADAAYLVETQVRKEKEQEEKVQEVQHAEALTLKQAAHDEIVANTEIEYINNCQSVHQGSDPLLLDEVLIPVKESSTAHSSNCIHNA